MVYPQQHAAPQAAQLQPRPVSPRQTSPIRARASPLAPAAALRATNANGDEHPRLTAIEPYPPVYARDMAARPGRRPPAHGGRPPPVAGRPSALDRPVPSVASKLDGPALLPPALPQSEIVRKVSQWLGRSWAGSSCVWHRPCMDRERARPYAANVAACPACQLLSSGASMPMRAWTNEEESWRACWQRRRCNFSVYGVCMARRHVLCVAFRPNDSQHAGNTCQLVLCARPRLALSVLARH